MIHLQLGDLPSWLAAIGTVGATGTALYQVNAERKRRISQESYERRFEAAVAQLGSDQAAVRLAGVYALAGVADDWIANRQTCIDVLCAYLRTPWEPDPGPAASRAVQLAFRAYREVRHTAIRVISAHLRTDAAISWQGLNFDFTGTVFDGGDFTNAHFSDGIVSFSRAAFPDGRVVFSGATFSGATVSFSEAEFSGGAVDFFGSRFSGGTVSFGYSRFSGGAVSFSAAEFSGGAVDFSGATFSGGAVDFSGAKFSGGAVSFPAAGFSGSDVNFGGAMFLGGIVDFSDSADWSIPPRFDWDDVPPLAVRLPGSSGDVR